MEEKGEAGTHKPMDTRNCQNPEGAREHALLGFSEEAWPQQHLDFGLLALRTVKE